MQENLASYPEPHQLCDRRLVFPQGTHVGVLLEGGHIVVDIQHVDPDPAGGLLPAPIPGDDRQGEALDELIVQLRNQHDQPRVLVQGEPVSGEGERGYPGVKQLTDRACVYQPILAQSDRHKEMESETCLLFHLP